MLLADQQPLVRRSAMDGRLDLVQLKEPPPCMCPAGSERDSTFIRQRLKASVAVDLQDPAERLEVFASMTNEDIEPDFAQGRKGVFAFRLFLHFARTGRMTMAESTGRDYDSVFEEQVAKALQARGYQIHRQVGLAGFFIDLAVADAERLGRYLLGIECDGAACHNARSARDRDRLRQSVLESHAWTIHRVWSTDWSHRPAEQLDLIEARIAAAKAEHDAGLAARATRAVSVKIVTVEREDVTEIGLAHVSGEAAGGNAYVEAVLTRPSHRFDELHETPTGILTALVEDVVRIEGPVHVDKVIDRIRDAWGLKRTGGRIQQAVERAVDVTVRTGRIERADDFLSIPQSPICIRDRTNARSTSLRRADMLPPTEIAAAVSEIVQVNFGAALEQIVQAVWRAFGIKATSSVVRHRIGSEVGRMVERGEITSQGGILIAIPCETSMADIV